MTSSCAIWDFRRQIDGAKSTSRFGSRDGCATFACGEARDLVRAQVSVIFAGGPPAALAAKAATTAIPIVFSSGEDPVKIGPVASYNRPGGNVTGVANLIEVLGAKRLGLLREFVPADTSIAVLLNPTEATFDMQLNDVQESARALGQEIQVLRASTEREIDAAFATAVLLRAGGMLVGVSFFYTIYSTTSSPRASSVGCTSRPSAARHAPIKAGYIDARPLTAHSTKSSCNARPDHTCGSFTSFPPSRHARFAPKADAFMSTRRLSSAGKQLLPAAMPLGRNAATCPGR